MGRDREVAFPRCANCAIEIEWGPTVLHGELYCCIGCAHGGPCSCDYSELPRQVVVLEEPPTGGRYKSPARYSRRR